MCKIISREQETRIRHIIKEHEELVVLKGQYADLLYGVVGENWFEKISTNIQNYPEPVVMLYEKWLECDRNLQQFLSMKVRY